MDEVLQSSSSVLFPLPTSQLTVSARQHHTNMAQYLTLNRAKLGCEHRQFFWLLNSVSGVEEN